MNFWDKYWCKTLTIEDQKEVLKDPERSYWFASENILGSDFKSLQEHACKDPHFAYVFARNIPGADIKYCQEHACKAPNYAYLFAKHIPGADIKYCFKHAFPEDEYGPDRCKSEYKKFIMLKACE